MSVRCRRVISQTRRHAPRLRVGASDIRSQQPAPAASNQQYIARMDLPEPIDLLAIAAHRDDVELTCGGTLAKAARLGQRTAILDLTQGEMGTRGSAEVRAREAEKAASVIGASLREHLRLPDSALQHDPAS